jgi:hypothetical protein
MRTKHAFTAAAISVLSLVCLVPQTRSQDAEDHSVALALKWLASQQNDDGSWSFDLPKGPADDDSLGRGTFKQARNGATGLAMLAFLGKGQTHKEGVYEPTVKKGLEYLIRNMKVAHERGNLEDLDGRFYSHVWATLALCEAYAMTGDKSLAKPTQLGLNHIGFNQDPKTGGWRYKRDSPCNLALLGWTLLALKTGHMAYLELPPEKIQAMSKFLDSVQSVDGDGYGYTEPGADPTATVIGLTSRRCLGWRSNHESLQNGLDSLSDRGPRPGRLNETYFATLLFRLAASDEAYRKWLSDVQDQLSPLQAASGRHRGSWHLRSDDPGTVWGGRLYCTVMCALILEVRYHWWRRPRPVDDDDFPL